MTTCVLMAHTFRTVVGTYYTREVGGVLFNVKLVMNIAFEQLINRLELLRERRCGSMPAMTIFLACAPTSSFDDDYIQPYIDLETFCRKENLPQGPICDFNAEISPMRTYEELHIGIHDTQWNVQWRGFPIMTMKTMHV